VGVNLSFKDALQREAGTEMQYLRALVESRPELIRIPDQWLIVNYPLSTADRIQACRGSDGSHIFVYTSSGKPVSLRLRDKIHGNLTGKVARAYWYDPRKGTSTPIGEIPRPSRATAPRTCGGATSRASSRPPSKRPRKRLGAGARRRRRELPGAGEAVGEAGAAPRRPSAESRSELPVRVGLLLRRGVSRQCAGTRPITVAKPTCGDLSGCAPSLCPSDHPDGTKAATPPREGR